MKILLLCSLLLVGVAQAAVYRPASSRIGKALSARAPVRLIALPADRLPAGAVIPTALGPKSAAPLPSVQAAPIHAVEPASQIPSQSAEIRWQFYSYP